MTSMFSVPGSSGVPCAYTAGAATSTVRAASAAVADTPIHPNRFVLIPILREGFAARASSPGPRRVPSAPWLDGKRHHHPGLEML